MILSTIEPRSRILAYGTAVIITMAALGSRLVFVDVFQGYPFVTIFPAVVLSTFVGGLGPGVLTLLLGGAGAWYFLVHAAQEHGSSSSDIIGVLVYAMVAAFTIWSLHSLKALAERERTARTGLRAALDEKSELLRERELLLTEIRHRVGNNLQQITGLLMLHARQIGDPVARAAFENARTRVNLFADIHQQLYRTGNDKVDLKETISRVINDLVSAYRPTGVDCRVEVSPSFVWPTDMAVPVIMVAQELVSNALEHGFGDDASGTITVSLGHTPDGLVRLTVRDDGLGPPPGLDPEQAQTLGLSIVRAFARQLRGSFALRPGPGGRGTVGELVFGEGDHHADRRMRDRRQAA